MTLETIDIIIIAGYAIALLGIALFVSREPEGHDKNTEDYFLAGRALPWWAIGASLIASNISAEQIIGQSGQGFAGDLESGNGPAPGDIWDWRRIRCSISKPPNA